jgi:dual-specificity kinase
VHFSWQKGIVLNSRYKVEKLLGDGTFGRVLGAHDKRDNRDVAIKVIRDVERYIENAKIEADILKKISKVDPKGTSSRSAIMCDTFMYQKHYCLVMESCGVSLYDFLKSNDFRGFWMQDIQSFAQQSLEALAFLHRELQMTHTDLKPENILLESAEPGRPAAFPREERWKARKSASESRESSPKSSPDTEYVRPATARIKLIDFGNATYANEHHSSIINTRQYRGPEVILSLGWNERSDIWSMGCILMELYTGELLFGTHENLEHMSLMERILEPMPSSLLAAATKEAKEKHLKHNQRSDTWQLNALAAKSASYVRSQVPLKEMVEPQHLGFASFVSHLLTLDQAKRPWAADALELPFLSKSYDD